MPRKKQEIYIIVRKDKELSNVQLWTTQGCQLQGQYEYGFSGRFYNSLEEAKEKVAKLTNKFNRQYYIFKAVLLAEPKLVPVKFTKLG